MKRMQMKMNAKQPRNECEPESRAKHEECQSPMKGIQRHALGP